MKVFVVFAAIVACAVAASLGQSPDASARVIQEFSELNPDGTWKNGVQVDNGIAQQQQGQLKQVPGAESPSISVSGSYSQPGPDGQPLTVTYIADENGFQPQGAHLPQPPQA